MFLFQAIQARKKCFTILQNEKTLVQAMKTTNSRSCKIENFAKGLVHGIGPKLAIFPSFYFKQYRPGKCEIFRKGFAPGDGPKIGHFSIFLFQQRPEKWVEKYWRLQKREVQKVLILIFFQRGQSMVLVLNSPFFHLFILGNIEKSVFHGILKRQNAFFGSKNKKFKKSKKG